MLGRLPAHLEKLPFIYCDSLNLLIRECVDVSESAHEREAKRKEKLSDTRFARIIETENDNDSEAAHNEAKASAHKNSRCLKFVLTDMDTRELIAFEYQHIHSITADNIIGQVLCLAGRVDLSRGIAFLTNDNCAMRHPAPEAIENAPFTDFSIPDSLLFDE